MRAHYFAQRKRFFTLLIVATLLSLGRDYVLNHALPQRLNFLFHLGYIAIAVAGILVAKEWFHKALALFTAIAFVQYITTLFARLPH